LLAHVLPEDRDRLEDAVKQHLERREPFDIEYRMRRKDGRTIWCHDVGQAVWDEGGRVTRFSGSISDITARKEAEARVVQLIAERDTLLENAPVGIAFLKDRQVMQCNQAFAQMLGYERAELLGRSTRPLYESEAIYEARGREAYQVIAKRGSLAGDAPMRRKDGSVLWVHHRVSPVDRSDLSQGIVWAIQDVSERKQAEERLAHLAHHDILTELPNRSLFGDRLNQALVQARRDGSLVGILFVDIDRFKVTNDTLGHEVGDRLLRAVADRLNASLRAGDTVARFGGDEFAVILPGIDTARAAGNVAQKILTVLAKPITVAKHQVYISASIGVTVYPADSDDPEALIRNADIAMYRAKEQGGNTYQYFTQEINAKALRYLKLETELRRALAEGEFRLHYQPRVEVASGRITGIEALLRWQSPDHALQPPAEFVPLLEESGLIIPVGEWVLATACRQAKTWEQAGLPRVPIAVNVSARQFRRGNLPQTVTRVLRETGLAPDQLELEIPENAMMLDAGEAIPALAGLKALGVGLSIDDFGTGYSSLNYLKRFDVDSLKIDRSFIKDITLDADIDTITMAIIAVAHALGCKVIAEGVETRAQLEFLSGQGCDEYQGYFFSKPLDADALEALWRSRSAGVATLDLKRAIR
ncbi:MAG TPA: EAL domain-containing protein, partial [Casimicrobiaceae bacterium]